MSGAGQCWIHNCSGGNGDKATYEAVIKLCYFLCYRENIQELAIFNSSH